MHVPRRVNTTLSKISEYLRFPFTLTNWAQTYLRSTNQVFLGRCPVWCRLVFEGKGFFSLYNAHCLTPTVENRLPQCERITIEVNEKNCRHLLDHAVTRVVGVSVNTTEIFCAKKCASYSSGFAGVQHFSDKRCCSRCRRKKRNQLWFWLIR